MNRTLLSLLMVVLAIAGCKKDKAPPPDAAEKAGVVEILATVAERVGIRTAPVKREHLARTITAPTELVLDPDRTAHLSPLVQAKVDRVAVKLGDHVRAGSPLAVLRSVAAGESRASLTQAEADLELARATLRRQEELRAANIGSERAQQEAVAASRRAEAALAAARERTSVVGTQELRSPIEGTVLERHATIGESVGPETVLFTIGDLRRVWAIGQVYERDVGAVRPGAAARLSLEAYPGRSWEGHLSYVAGALQHESRTLPVRFELDNADGVLRPGLFGSLAIEASDAVDALAVPAEAIQRIGDKAVVFVREPCGGDRQCYRVRTVVLGRDTGRLVEIREGLHEGAEVAVSGTFTLKGELLRELLVEEE